MSTPPIPPVASTAQVILQGVSSGGGASGATTIPPGILALPQGTLLRGHVVHIDAQSGLATLRTPKGDLSLKTDIPLARGSEIVIRLDTVSAGLKARIISVDGFTPRELESAQARTSVAQQEVEDLIDLPHQPAPQTAGKQTLPTSTAPRTTPATLPPVQDIVDIPVLDSLEITTHMPVIRAALLSRTPELPQLLRQLPASVFISPQRLEAGATLSVTILPQSIQLPEAGAGAPTSTLPPTATNTAMALSAGNAPTPAPAITLPLPATTPSGANIPLPTTGNIGAPQTASAPLPAPQPQTASSFPVSAITSSLTPARFITLPGGGYAPNPLAPVTPGYTLTLADSPAALSTPPVSTSPVSVPPASAALTARTPATPDPAITLAVPAPPPSPPSTTAKEIAPATISSSVTTTQIPAAAAIPATVTPPAFPVATSPLPTEIITPSQPTSAPGLSSTVTMAALPQTSATDPLLAKGILPAQVIGTEQSGETVLKTPFGIMKLELSLPNGQRLMLPPETKLNLQLLALENETTSIGGTGVTAPASLSELSHQWDSLRETVALLQHTHPLAAQHLLQNIVPQPGPKMAKEILFFLLGLQSDDASDWLDKKTIEALEQQNRGDLARKLSADFGTLKQLYVESPSPNWQAVFVPVHYQGEWQQTRLFIKKEKSDTAKGKDEAAGTRFIMEVELSRLGAMQFDGFVKKHPQSTHFDLVIRSAMALPTPDQQAIRQIFIDASALTGFKGGISFQVGQPFPILPLEEILKPDRNVIA